MIIWLVIAAVWVAGCLLLTWALCRAAALADRHAAGIGSLAEWPEFDVLGEAGDRSRDGWV